MSKTNKAQTETPVETPEEVSQTETPVETPEEVSQTETPVETPEEKKKVKTYKCVRTCFWNNEYFRDGDIIKSDRTDLPAHFVAVN